MQASLLGAMLATARVSAHSRRFSLIAQVQRVRLLSRIGQATLRKTPRGEECAFGQDVVVVELGKSRIVDYESESTNLVRLEFEGISQASREEALVLRVGVLLFEASASDRC